VLFFNFLDLSLTMVRYQTTMKELSEKIGKTESTVTVLVDKLVDYGCVVK